MSQEKGPLIELVDTPTTAPVRVPCVEWEQAGHPVFSGICPVCRPGLTLAGLGEAIRTEGQGHVHVNQPGKIICRCGTYLELYLAE